MTKRKAFDDTGAEITVGSVVTIRKGHVKDSVPMVYRNDTVMLEEEGVTYHRGVAKLNKYWVGARKWLKDVRVTNPQDIPDLKMQLRPYQEDAVDVAYFWEEGIIELPEQSDLNAIGMGLISKMKQKTLWIAKDISSCYAVVHDAQEYLGLTPSVLAGNVKFPPRPVSVISINDFMPIADKIKNHFGLIIIGDLNNIDKQVLLKLGAMLPARFRFGLCPAKASKISEFVLGPIMSLSYLNLSNSVARPAYKVVETKHNPSTDSFVKRNVLIACHALMDIKVDDKVMVIVKNEVAVKNLVHVFNSLIGTEKFPKPIKLCNVHEKTDSKKREAALRSFSEYSGGLLIISQNCLDCCRAIREVDCCLMASDYDLEFEFILDSLRENDESMLVDFVDDNDACREMAAERLEVYKEFGLKRKD